MLFLDPGLGGGLMLLPPFLFNILMNRRFMSCLCSQASSRVFANSSRRSWYSLSLCSDSICTGAPSVRCPFGFAPSSCASYCQKTSNFLRHHHSHLMGTSRGYAKAVQIPSFSIVLLSPPWIYPRTIFHQHL